MLDARDLACVRGERTLFAHMNLQLRPGDYCELRGPNGSGKTNLLRILSGLQPPSCGEVRWHGEPIHRIRERYQVAMTYLAHRPAIKRDLTAVENLRVAAALAGMPVSASDARQVLARFELQAAAEPGRSEPPPDRW